MIESVIKAVQAAAGGEQWKLVQSHRLDGAG